jgi:hypothetical protein
MEWVRGLYLNMSIPLMFWSFVLYVVLQIVAVIKLRGVWRIASLILAAPMTLVLLATVVGLFLGSNLWPLLMLFAGPPALLCVVVLLAAFAVRQGLARKRVA